MINLGETQEMLVARKTQIGVYLNPLDDPDHEGILLPKKYIEDELQTGDKINVFIYRDSQDRLIATTLIPKVVAYQIGLLKVVSVTSFGAFLDWGLEKDLFLPKTEITSPLFPGDECMVYVNIDHKEKIYATTNIQSFLLTQGIFKPDDRVKGIVYKIVPDVGAFVAIDHKYMALIAKNELFKTIMPGDMISARVKHIKEDGKIDLAIRERSFIERTSDAQIIYEYLVSHNGFLNMNDKSSPETIKETFGISKLSFKKALGKLLKEQKIVFEDSGIKLSLLHNTGPSEK